MKPSVCLCVMVRDEAATIGRLVESVREHIDSYVIVDTGSTDGTQEVARRALDGIPGELHEHEWKDFGNNRTRMLEVARGKADYLLLMDADWTLNVEPGALDHLGTQDYYLVHNDGDLAMSHKVFVSGSRPWRAIGTVHEYITCEDPVSYAELRGVTWTHHADGGSRAGRFEQDEPLLRGSVAAVSREVFYLAQTLQESGREQEAADLYVHRAGLGGWDQEVAVSLLRAGRIRGDLELLLRAWATCVDRLEPLYEIAWRLRDRGLHSAAALLLRDVSIDMPVPDGLFVEKWVYEWGLAFERALALHNTGDMVGASIVYTLLLRWRTLPELYREQIEENMQSIAIRVAAE